MSYEVTAKLICVFVFAYAKSRFSHDEAHFRPDGLRHFNKEHPLYYLSRVMRKPAFCESKGADQIRCNHTLDHHLCFSYFKMVQFLYSSQNSKLLTTFVAVQSGIGPDRKPKYRCPSEAAHF